MQDIKMQTQGKGDKRDRPASELPDHTGCLVLTALDRLRATACLGTCCNSRAWSVPRACWYGDLISHARQDSLVSNSLGGNQLLTPEEGVMLIRSGDDSLTGFE